LSRLQIEYQNLVRTVVSDGKGGGRGRDFMEYSRVDNVHDSGFKTSEPRGKTIARRFSWEKGSGGSLNQGTLREHM